MIEEPWIPTSPDVRRPRPQAALTAIGLDLIVVVAFVLIGRLSHDEELSAAGLLGTGWPFLVGLAGGWLGVRLIRSGPLSLPSGLMVLAKTVVIGMLLRYCLAKDDTPAAFIAVATGFLGVGFVGWRLVGTALSRRAAGPQPARPRA